MISVINYQCPYCWEQNESHVEQMEDEQTFIEDCRVCCHPIQITITVFSDEITRLDVERAM